MAERLEFEIEEDSHTKHSSRSVPKLTMTILGCLVFLDIANFTCLLSLVPYLVGFYDHGASDSTVSILAGVLGSSYSLAQFLSNFGLGTASDHYGRKPLLIIGTLSIMCSNIAFIFIRSYRLALLARTLCGLTVANSAIARSYIAETTTEGSRPGAFAALNVFSILGMIAGPLIGGFLSRPTTTMPGSVLDNDFLSERVYSFPFVVLACLSVLVLLTTVIGLKESKSVKKSEPLLESQHYRQIDEADQPLSARMSIQLLKHNRSFIAAVVSIMLMQLVLGMQLESVVIWARIGRAHGGLGWATENWAAMVYGAGGLSILLFTALCASPILAMLGDRTATITFSFLAAPIIALYPYAHAITSDAGTLVFCMCFQALWTACGGMFMVSNNLYLNNSVDKRVLGSANGMQGAFSSLLRAFGPLLAGLMFGWTASNGLGFPLNYCLPFLLGSVLCMFACLFIFGYTKSN